MTVPEADPGALRRVVTIATVAAGALAASVGIFTPLALLDGITLAAVLVLLPVLGVAQVPVARGVRVERLPAYGASIATILFVGGLCAVVGARRGGGGALGLNGLPPGALVGWTVALVAGGLGVITLFRVVSVHVGVVESDLLRALLPRTRPERWTFAGLSAAAGLGEEIAYRGYAIPVLAGVLGGAAPAAVVTSLAFGVLHAYQGPLGMVRTATLGGLLALGFLASGSLWPPIIAHTVLDLLAGLVLGERLTAPPACGSVPTSIARGSRTGRARLPGP